MKRIGKIPKIGGSGGRTRYIVTIDVPDSRVSFAEDFFKAISFVKEVIPFETNEVTNPDILQSIDSYESKTGYWSRRINLEHRIVYKVESERIIVHSIFGHYQ